MNPEMTALRVAAWLTLIYVALGVVVCTFLWLPVMVQGPPVSIDWSVLPWHISVPLFMSEICVWVWLPVGVLLNALAMVAFFREAGGCQARRMFWFYGCSIVALAIFEIGLTVYFILLSPIRTSANTSQLFSWEDALGGLVVGLALCFPLLLRLGISLLWGRRHAKDPGYCITCGYNLMGNVSGVCPECGEGM